MGLEEVGSSSFLEDVVILHACLGERLVPAIEALHTKEILRK